MKTVIDIPENRYNLLKRVKEDKLSEFEYYVYNGTPLPGNATNGDMIKALFPNANIEYWAEYSTYNVEFPNDNDVKHFSYDWWNTLYTKEGDEGMRALTPEENERKQKMYRDMSEPILDGISLLNELKADIENLSRKIQLRQDGMRDSIDLDRFYGGNIENHVTPHNPTRETYTKLDGKLSAYDEVLELIEGYRAKKEPKGKWLRRAGYYKGSVGDLDEDIKAFDMAIEALKAEPCEDAVSREEVDKLSRELVHVTRDKADYLCHFWARLQELPPAIPARAKGEWIVSEFDENVYCSECAAEYEDVHNFCPNCGSDMRGEQMTREQNVKAILESNFIGYREDYIDMVVKSVMKLKEEHCEDELDFVQPHKRIPVTLDLNNSCEDCVSREAVLELTRLEEIIPPSTDELNVHFTSYRNVIFASDVKKLPPVTPKPKTGHCRDCKWWKDSDGVYRRGIGAESKCPINRREVMEGKGYCFLYEPQEVRNEEWQNREQIATEEGDRE